MNIEEEIKKLRNIHNGKSFSMLAERCETSVEAPYRIRKAEKIGRDEVVVLCLAGGGGDKINLWGCNSMLKKVDDFVKKECGGKPRVLVACSEFGNFCNWRLARKAMHYKVSWPKHYEELKRSVGEKYYDETFEPQYIKDIFREIFEPRIADDRGGRLKLDEVLRNIRCVNIVSHCHGGYVAMELENLLVNRMEELGYSLEEQNRIKEQLLVLAYNPDCPYVVSKVKYVGIVSSQDSSCRYNNYMREWLLMEPRKFGVMYLTCKWGRTLMCDGVNENFVKDVKIEKVEKGDDLFKIKKGVGEHEFLGFEVREGMSKSSCLLQRFGGNILVNGVLNSLRQDEKYVRLLNIENLVARNFKDKVLFAKACFVGYNLEQSLFREDLKKIDEYANWKRSLPVVEL